MIKTRNKEENIVKFKYMCQELDIRKLMKMSKTLSNMFLKCSKRRPKLK